MKEAASQPLAGLDFGLDFGFNEETNKKDDKEKELDSDSFDDFVAVPGPTTAAAVTE